jgi:hypothetical protein
MSELATEKKWTYFVRMTIIGLCLFLLGGVFFTRLNGRYHSAGAGVQAAFATDDQLDIHKPKEEFPKLAPFDGVRWQGATPEVHVDSVWYQLKSLDGVSATEIVEFCKKTYANKWQKRFEEDLVEVLTKMGHRPGDKVTLALQAGTGPERKLENIEMTEENRKAVRDAAMKRDGKLDDKGNLIAAPKKKDT